MSLHTLVHGGLAHRLHLRRDAVGARVRDRAIATAPDEGAGSMRGLEAIIALTSIGAAILIGLAR